MPVMQRVRALSRRAKMDTDMEERSCGSCDTKLFEPRTGDRSPCPVCGSLKRRMTACCSDTVLFMDGMRMKARREGVKRPIWEAINEPSFFYKAKSWHRVERHIDREHNLYIEIITDMSTGKLVRRVEEPLSIHIGHGSDKNSGK